MKTVSKALQKLYLQFVLISLNFMKMRIKILKERSWEFCRNNSL